MTEEPPKEPYPVGPIANAKREALVARVGAAVNNFSAIELQLLLLFAKCIGIPTEVAARMLAPVKNFSLTLGVIDGAVQHKLKPLGALPYWDSLREYIIELSGDRNQLAHTMIAFHAPGPPEAAKDEELEPKVGPSVTDFLLGDARKNPIDISEAEELVKDFWQAAELVSLLQTALGPPLPERFSQQISRRRPPRSTRLAASQPKGPIRPPSSRPKRDKKKERGEKK